MKKKINKAASTTVVEAPVKKTKKSTTKKTTSKEKVAKLDDANATSVTKKVIDKKAITDKKDLKYRYPKTADDIPSRKAFRAEVRRKIAAFEKELGKLQFSKHKEDQELFEKKREDYDKYRVRVLATPVN